MDPSSPITLGNIRPDKWDPDYGLELAVKKAAADIMRQWDEYLNSELEGVIDD